MASNAKRGAAPAAPEAPKPEPVVESTKPKPRKPLSALVNYLATAAELQGLDNAIRGTLAAVDVVVDNNVASAETIKEALKKTPMFRRHFVEEETAKVMSNEEIKTLVAQLQEAEKQLEARKTALRTAVEKLSNGVITYGVAGIQPAMQAPANEQTTAKGKRYVPRLQHYQWSLKDHVVTLDKEGNVWVCSVDGLEFSRSESFTKAVEETYSQAFGLTSSMSVPRVARMREQEAAAGLEPIE